MSFPESGLRAGFLLRARVWALLRSALAASQATTERFCRRMKRHGRSVYHPHCGSAISDFDRVGNAIFAFYTSLSLYDFAVQTERRTHTHSRKENTVLSVPIMLPIRSVTQTTTAAADIVNGIARNTQLAMQQ